MESKREHVVTSCCHSTSIQSQDCYRSSEAVLIPQSQAQNDEFCYL